MLSIMLSRLCLFIFVIGKVVEGAIEEQTKQVFLNLTEVLKAAGSSLDKVVKTTVFLKDMNDFAAMNAVYATVSIQVKIKG